MLEWRRGIVPLTVALCLLGCSQKGFKTNLHVQTDAVEGSDFSAYSGWNFARATEYPITGIDDLDRADFRADLVKHVTREMKARGYVREQLNPDVWLAFHVVVENKFDEKVMDEMYSGYDMAWANVNSESTWREGSLIIFALDSKTGAQVWSGTATAEIDEYATYQKRTQRFMEVVSQMLAEIPMGTAPTE